MTYNLNINLNHWGIILPQGKIATLPNKQNAECAFNQKKFLTITGIHRILFYRHFYQGFFEEQNKSSGEREMKWHFFESLKSTLKYTLQFFFSMPNDWYKFIHCFQSAHLRGLQLVKAAYLQTFPKTLLGKQGVNFVKDSTRMPTSSPSKTPMSLLKFFRMRNI